MRCGTATETQDLAIFEPRSSTTRRAVFQQQLCPTNFLSLADGVFISLVRLGQIQAQDD